jgi:hypothetical protein
MYLQAGRTWPKSPSNVRRLVGELASTLHPMSKKKRVKLPRTLEKRVFAEAGSKCPFCGEAEVVSLQVHHIDGDPANNSFENLIPPCATCHTKISSGIMSQADVRRRKNQLGQPNGGLAAAADPVKLLASERGKLATVAWGSLGSLPAGFKARVTTGDWLINECVVVGCDRTTLELEDAATGAREHVPVGWITLGKDGRSQARKVYVESKPLLGYD